MDVLANGMQRKIKLSREEIVLVMDIMQNYQSLKIVKNIIEFSPERIKEFGFDDMDFSNLDDELEEAVSKCREWWLLIANKYSISKDSEFRVDYDTCILTLI